MAAVMMNMDQTVTVDLGKWIDQIVNVQNLNEVVAELHNLGIYRVEHLKIFAVEDVLKLGLRKYERQRFVAALRDIICAKRDQPKSPDYLDRPGSVSKQAEQIHVDIPHTSELTDAEDSPDIVNEPSDIVSNGDSSPTASPHHLESTEEQQTEMTGQPIYLDTHASVSNQGSDDVNPSECPHSEQGQVGTQLVYPLSTSQTVRKGATEKELIVEHPGNDPSNHPAEQSKNMCTSSMETDQIVHSSDTGNDRVTDIGSDHTCIQNNVNKRDGSSKSLCATEKIWFDNEPIRYGSPQKTGIIDDPNQKINLEPGCSKTTHIIKPVDGNTKVYSSACVLENNHHQNPLVVVSDGKESGSKFISHSIHDIIGNLDQSNANKKHPSPPENRAKNQEMETPDVANIYHNLEQTNIKANCDQEGRSNPNDSIVKPPLQPLPKSHEPSESTGETSKDKRKRKDRERQQRKYEEIKKKKKEDPAYAAQKRLEWKLSKRQLRTKKKNKTNLTKQPPVQNLPADDKHLVDSGVDGVSSTTNDQSHVNRPSRIVPVSEHNMASLNATSTNPPYPETIYEPVSPCPQPCTPYFPDTPVGAICRNEIVMTGLEHSSANTQLGVVTNAIKWSLNVDNTVQGLEYDTVDQTHNVPSLSAVAQGNIVNHSMTESSSLNDIAPAGNSSFNKKKKRLSRYKLSWKKKLETHIRGFDVTPTGEVMFCTKKGVGLLSADGAHIPNPFESSKVKEPMHLAVNQKTGDVVITERSMSQWIVYKSADTEWHEQVHTLAQEWTVGPRWPVCWTATGQVVCALNKVGCVHIVKYDQDDSAHKWSCPTVNYVIDALVVDRCGYYYCCFVGTDGVHVYDTEGLLIHKIQRTSSPSYWGPRSICMDSKNRLLVLHREKPRLVVVLLDRDGTFIAELLDVKIRSTSSWGYETLLLNDKTFILSSGRHIRSYNIVKALNCGTSISQVNWSPAINSCQQATT